MKKYSANAKDYKLYEEVGEGVSATVYRALCIPFNEIVAIKVLDLERCNNDLEGIRREVQTMSLIDHQNVVRAHCSFATGRHLWVVMPYMAGGSCLHIMKTAYPEGFEQPVIATLLFEVLKALTYLHAHGYIHRDVKAGNILLDSNGTVKLGDFGVSAGMFEGGDRQRPRNTFVGTPCWMAPEVMQQLHGYDFKADIWSFGITALELAHGHAPFSKYPPMKVLLMTLQNAPPGLDYERDKRFSKSFKEIVAACLVKDPKKRPTSDKLLKHHFFKHARSKDLLVRTVLTSLPPLGDRFKTLKEKEANLLLQNQAIHGDNEHLSQQEYIRGISAWNFNLDDLKRQAALIEDSDVIPSKEIQELYSSKIHEHDSASLAGSSSIGRTNNAAFETTCEAGLGDVPKVEASVPAEQLVPQEFGSYLDDADVNNAKESFANSSIFEPLDMPSVIEDEEIQMIDVENAEEEQGFQCKGRFRIVSPDSSCKESSSGFSHIIGGGGSVSSTTKSAPLLTSLQNLMQQNSMQKDLIMRLIKSADWTADPQMEFADVTSTSENFQFTPTSLGRERELQAQVIQMQQSVGRMVEELQRQKMKNAQLEKQLTALRNKRSEG